MLTLGAITVHGASDVRVVQDSLVGVRALEANAGTFGRRGFHHPDSLEQAFRDVRLVLLRLSKSNDRLDEIARAVARFAAPDVVLLCGGVTKHMNLGQNDVLRRYFGEVTASRGRGKSRLLIAQDPLRAQAARADTTNPWPRSVHVDELGMTLVAHGGVFAGTSLDQGTRVLLDVMDDAVPTARTAVDLGCGNGVIATEIARRRPALRVIATDVSAIAVASTRATAEVNGVSDRIEVLRTDAGDELAEGSAQLVLCNPPFHADTTVTTDAAEAMFRNAATILQSGANCGASGTRTCGTGRCLSGWSARRGKSCGPRSSPSPRHAGCDRRASVGRQRAQSAKTVPPGLLGGFREALLRDLVGAHVDAVLIRGSLMSQVTVR
ncbi:methyltransferase [Curtobacterium flaccumfaciens]|nr:methyltransferase [Curtobacterium flaccumfaciens]